MQWVLQDYKFLRSFVLGRPLSSGDSFLGLLCLPGARFWTSTWFDTATWIACNPHPKHFNRTSRFPAAAGRQKIFKQSTNMRHTFPQTGSTRCWFPCNTARNHHGAQMWRIYLSRMYWIAWQPLAAQLHLDVFLLHQNLGAEPSCENKNLYLPMSRAVKNL